MLYGSQPGAMGGSANACVVLIGEHEDCRWRERDDEGWQVAQAHHCEATITCHERRVAGEMQDSPSGCHHRCQNFLILDDPSFVVLPLVAVGCTHPQPCDEGHELVQPDTSTKGADGLANVRIAGGSSVL